MSVSTVGASALTRGALSSLIKPENDLKLERYATQS